MNDGTSRVPVLMRDIQHAVIIAYEENVNFLQDALRQEGFEVIVLRATYSDEELRLPLNSRTFLSHRRAWEWVAGRKGYTLICESDFVPCKGLGGFPVFWPVEDERAWGYLYQGSPRLLAVHGKGQWLRGHCAPLVAYVINATVARLMLQCFEQEVLEYGLEQYFNFDAHLQWGVMKRGGRAYIPLRHYGEHGGFPNREHHTLGMLSRRGEHHADRLQARLHFLPQYARGSWICYYRKRLYYYLLGWLRLLTGRWIYEVDVHPLSIRDRVEMSWIGVRRLLV